MEILVLGEEPRARAVRRDVVVLLVRERLDIPRAGLDRRLLDVRAGIARVRLSNPDVLEEELVAPGDAELPFLKQDAHLGRRAVYVVRQRFDDDGNLVRC